MVEMLHFRPFSVKHGEFGDRRTCGFLRRISRMDNACGGDSVAELAERFASAGGEVTRRLGDVFHAGETQDAHGEATQSRHHMRSVFGPDLREVFAVGGIADIMITVFNLPMAPGHAQQVFWSRPIFGYAGESKGAIVTDFSAFHVDDDALDPEGLTQMGEDYARCPGGDGNFAVFIATMTDISRFGAEGENPPKGGMPDGCVVFAGCL